MGAGEGQRSEKTGPWQATQKTKRSKMMGIGVRKVVMDSYTIRIRRMTTDPQSPLPSVRQEQACHSLRLSQDVPPDGHAVQLLPLAEQPRGQEPISGTEQVLRPA